MYCVVIWGNKMAGYTMTPKWGSIYIINMNLITPKITLKFGAVL